MKFSAKHREMNFNDMFSWKQIKDAQNNLQLF